MPAFFDDISSFYGTGERNVSGQTLEEFLELYDPYKYKNPCCTTDAVVFSYREKLDSTLTGLKLLLVKRSNHPSIGFWALPGGFIELQEDIDQTDACRISIAYISCPGSQNQYKKTDNRQSHIGEHDGNIIVSGGYGQHSSAEQ